MLPTTLHTRWTAIHTQLACVRYKWPKDALQRRLEDIGNSPRGQSGHPLEGEGVAECGDYDKV